MEGRAYRTSRTEGPRQYRVFRLYVQRNFPKGMSATRQIISINVRDRFFELDWSASLCQITRVEHACRVAAYVLRT